MILFPLFKIVVESLGELVKRTNSEDMVRMFELRIVHVDVKFLV